jgi:hypothetical protein
MITNSEPEKTGPVVAVVVAAAVVVPVAQLNGQRRFRFDGNRMPSEKMGPTRRRPAGGMGPPNNSFFMFFYLKMPF